MSKNACFCIVCFFKDKGFWILRYTPGRCFELVVQNTVGASREGDQNRVNFRCRNYEVDWKYFICLSDNVLQSTYTYKIRGKAYVERFINNRPFKSLNELSDQIYQVEKVKTFFLSSCTPNLYCCKLITNSSPHSAIQTDMS